MKCDEPRIERCVARASDKIKFLVTECTYCGKIEASDQQDTNANDICNNFNAYRTCKLEKSATPTISHNTYPLTQEELPSIN